MTESVPASSGPGRGGRAAAADPHADGQHGGPAPRYLDREASELEYHARVLEMAARPDAPLLERCRFIAIFTQLTDEFFRVRIAGLQDRLAAGVSDRSRAGHTPVEELDHLHARYRELAERQAGLLHEELLPALADEGVRLVDWAELGPDEREELSARFEAEIYPILTPLAVGPAHPFPFISDLSLSLGVLLEDRGDGDGGFARVKVPEQLDRFLATGAGSGRVIAVEDVIGAHLDRLFAGRDVRSWHTFRVTRNADYTVEDVDVDDLLDAVAAELLDRRFGHAVRLEVDEGVPDEVRALLRAELDIDDDQVIDSRRPLALDDLWELLDLDRPDLKEEPLRPHDPPPFSEDADRVFAVLRDRDVLVQHPYDRFSSSTQRFIEAAADDPAVLALKQTIYRTSGDSPIVRALIRAAGAGKQVVAVVELKARFDEQANIEWAGKLEEAGVHVVYGFVDLKTHTKTALVVRRDDDGTVRRYGHIGTGNYNPSTARSYEDVGLFTSRDDVTADLGDLFNHLSGHTAQDRYDALLVSPTTLLPRLCDLIEEQAHPDGRIVIKVNNLSHVGVIDALYHASQAGASIDLIVRSICCLRPEVEDLSERIRVRSIVGGILEHSRILRFGHDPGPGAYLIGSADLMPRNLERRVEAVVPVDAPELRERLDAILASYLRDDVLAWRLHADGTWSKVATEEGHDAQAALAERYAH